MNLKTLIRRLCTGTEGAVAIMVGIGMTAMIGFLALGTETGLWYAAKRNLQSVADAAALGGAFELGSGSNSSVISAAAIQDAGRNGFQATGGATIAVHTPPASGKYAGNPQMVEVSVSQPTTLLFSALFLKSLQVNARAVAKTGSVGDACILALDNVINDAAYFTGSATVTLHNCGIAANSSSSNAVVVSGSATVTTAFVQSVGGYDISGSGVLHAGTIITHAAATADPYAGLSAPSAASCASVPKTKDFTLSPGTYCGGLTFQGNVFLNPGVYVISGGTFKITAQATVFGTGVTFVLINNAKLDVTGGSAITITAPTAGIWAGVAFFSDRKNELQVNKLNGNSVTNITGAIYMPSQELDFSGGNGTDASGCTRLIADFVKFIGNSSLGNSCAATGVASGASLRPVLVE
ncbi:hypothetical protein CCC_03887 [Paramagnetospirillum magnetotacticum MS-1]|uniref:Putative Flp pilus-assembly TadG-like N-terminal domain-containing protein n=1 Tax=Paramagnetospirillum magnetotacticum MS-1 TaxID=272627 RepID=A0A0C2YYH2_PARME|nr:Tad domain-containing protein [Paramagnetospirillum magnetotacticum]KIL99715.1 hypothetical protein CCC_03887 [Paramagnetospirillum magnetotacticum MS-1]